MKAKEVPIGEIFNIGQTPSYPKLKIDGGYVDMRDEVVNKTGNVDEMEVDLMTIEDLYAQFKAESATEKSSIDEWIEDRKSKYL